MKPGLGTEAEPAWPAGATGSHADGSRGKCKKAAWTSEAAGRGAQRGGCTGRRDSRVTRTGSLLARAPPARKSTEEDMGGRNVVGGLPCRRHHSSCPEYPQHTPLRTVPGLWEETQVSRRQRPGCTQGPGPEQQLPAAGESAQGCQWEEGSLPLALGREGPALARCDQTQARARPQSLHPASHRSGVPSPPPARSRARASEKTAQRQRAGSLHGC